MSLLLPPKLFTLVIIQSGAKVLLGLKKRGFGMNRYNGFGGKVEEGESILQAAHRELKEEAGICALDLAQRGFLEFTFVGDPKPLHVHVFHGTKFEGEVTESEEMQPEWFDIDKIPFAKMWPDDEQWFPLLLDNRYFHGIFDFQGENVIVSQSLVEVDGIEQLDQASKAAVAKTTAAVPN